ncbi:aldo/keto reductase [Legionella dresdenensis]|uniref:Aldo/keto reductase n=1 Tax=Legionella dresdenensis TaxID=450200 RepID=A0ABV8CHA5_9GAMM
MEFRQLGKSGFKVPLLGLGTCTFGGGTEFYKAWGNIGINEATRLIDMCIDAGLNFFDSADVYSKGMAEEILGKAIQGRRDQVIISTKATFRLGLGPNDIGSSRFHLLKSIDGQLKRLKTDYIDLYQMHGFDPLTPVEEVVRTLENLIQSGKIRYIGCSNFSGWQLMKSLAIADQLGTNRYVAQQVYYSLIGRDYEHELMPLALDQGLGTIVWSPLGGARLTGKILRGKPLPKVSRLHITKEIGPPVSNELLFDVMDTLIELSEETGKTVSQIAINWLLQKPTVCSVLIGVRSEEQLQQNLGAVGWSLTDEQIKKLDEISQQGLPYPYWHQARWS